MEIGSMKKLVSLLFIEMKWLKIGFFLVVVLLFSMCKDKRNRVSGPQQVVSVSDSVVTNSENSEYLNIQKFEGF